MTTLIRLLQERAAEEAGQSGFVFYFPGRETVDTLSLTELDKRAQAIASHLRRFAEPGMRVLLCYGPGLEFIQAFFGCLYAGIIAVPTELPRPKRDAARLKAITEDAKPVMLLTSRNNELQLGPLATSFGMQILATDSIANDEGSNWKAGPISLHDTAYLQYTSGSTATPKGVVITHGCVMSNLKDIDSEFQHDHKTVSVSWLPHFHDMGLVYGLLQPIFPLIKAVLLAPGAFVKEPGVWLEAISRYKATHSGGPDFGYARCIKNVSPEQLSRLDLSSWRVAFTGAEKVRQSTLELFSERFHSCGFAADAFYPAYGLAEATLKVTCRSRTRPLKFRTPLTEDAETCSYTSCGIPGSQTKIAIVDPKTGHTRETGRIGEVWVNSPSVASGYWRRPEESSETFDARIQGRDEMYLRTGDLGFMAFGELHVTGRCKDLVLINGRNRHPEDIEALVAGSHPSLNLRRCAAFSVEQNGIEELVIVIEGSSRSSIDLKLFSVIRQSVTEMLGVRVHTIAFVARGALPITSSGKIRRFACRDAWVKKALRVLACDVNSMFPANTVAGSSAEDDLTKRLCRIVADCLGVSAGEISLDIPLVQLGLDSIGAIQISGAIEAEFGILNSIERLLGGAALKDFYSEIRESKRSVRAPEKVATESAKCEVEYQPSLFQQRLWNIHHLIHRRGLLNIVRAILFEGELDVPRLIGALQRTTQRHEALRTSFSSQLTGLVASLSPVVDFQVPIVDLRELMSPGCALVKSALERAMTARHPDLSQPPPWSACILLLEPKKAELIWSISHLVADATSVDMLEHELAALYENTPAADDMSDSYGLFARSQLANRHGLAEARQLQFWTSQLQGAQPIRWPQVPRGKSTPRVIRRELSLSDEWQSGFENLCRHQAVTAFMALFAGFTLVLGRYIQRDTFVVSLPVDCRPRNFRKTVGCFANRLPVAALVNQRQKFGEHLQSIRRRVSEALDNRGIAMGEIQAALGSHRQASTPDLLSQVLFEFRERESLPRFGRSVAQSRSLDPPDLAFELFVVGESVDGLSLTFLFDGNFFDEPACTWFVNAYRQVITEMAENLTIALNDIVMPVLPDRSEERDVLEIDIAANFVADGVCESLLYWMKKLDTNTRLQVAPFNQIMQSILGSGFSGFKQRGVSVLFIQSESYLNKKEELPVLPAGLMEVAAALENESRRASGIRFIVLFCPPSPDYLKDDRLDAMETEFAESVRDLAAVDVVTNRMLKRLYPVAEYFDPHGDRMARIPYTRLCFASLGTMAARRIEAFRRHPRKVIVVDCDNTLWSGTLGEDDIAGLHVDECRVALQLFLLRQAESGRLLCICSKNDEPDVLNALDCHPDMLLRRDNFVAWRINWRPKADNLRALAAELNVGLESFICLDDSPVECAHLRDQCPEVLTLQLPTDISQLQAFLDSTWEFDTIRQTAEDRHRSQLYKQYATRRQSEKNASTIEEFLAGLELSVHIGEVDDRNLDRAAQLTERTSQFNLNGVRWSESELRAIANPLNSKVLLVRAKDRFGDYGAIGLMIYDCAKSLSVKAFLLSCRALGKRIEYRMALLLAENALSAGCEILDLQFIETRKNTAIRQFLSVFEPEAHEGQLKIKADTVMTRCRNALSPFEQSGYTDDNSLDIYHQSAATRALV